MIKDIWEDSKRYKSDQEINSRIVTVIRSHDVEEDIQWCDLKVGDIVRVANNHEIPADLLLLSSSREDGQCFVETANLDGESNLKLRTAHPQTSVYRTPAELHSLHLEVDVDEPNAKLYEFDGSIVVSAEEELPLTIDNFLHRGIVLRHTDHIHGLVLYTGHQTKYMMNSSRPHYKRTKLERYVNFFMAILIAGLLSICILSAVLGVVVYQYDVALDDWYLGFVGESGELADTLKDILTFVVVYSHFVPLTLYVKLEIVRFAQARIMEYDLRMYCKEKDAPVQVRASNLMEDLGQIEYIFSDKTGTLTRNEMVFRVCSIGGNTFGSVPDYESQHFDEEEYLSRLKDPDVEMKSIEESEEAKGVFDEQLESRLRDAYQGMRWDQKMEKGKGGEGEGDEIVVEDDGRSHDNISSELFFFLSLALCNTVIPSTIEGKVVFQASSPDEIALVLGARRTGIELKSRTIDECVVTMFGEDVTFEVLASNEFTSERRCMSVVVRFPDGSIYLLVKGADESLKELSNNSGSPDAAAALSAADQFAVKGLRTMLVGKRRMASEEYEEWAEKHWNEARLATDNRRQLLLDAAKLIERDVDILGTTGVEDRLQDAVSETISDLMKADIKIWVLTGDKSQTAINIAESCSLILPSFRLIRVKAEAKDDVEVVTNQLREGVGYAESEDCVLVIDGRAVDLIAHSDFKDEFIHLAKCCKSVVCCRSTPIQKQQTVEMMMEALDKRTLAIGDGANDVPMIQTAHVGVSVRGNEGMQAVLSSDVVLGEFRFLKRLLFVHGHWCYVRNSFLVFYLIYKGIFLTFIPFWYSIFDQWSGEVCVFCEEDISCHLLSWKNETYENFLFRCTSILGFAHCGTSSSPPLQSSFMQSLSRTFRTPSS
jgi:phospholipid-transporting ATPase